MNLLREAARERAKAVRPRKVQPGEKSGDDATAIQAAPAGSIGKPTSKAAPSPAIASAEPAPSYPAAAEQQASPAGQNVRRRAESRDAVPNIYSRELASDEPDRDLLHRLAKRHLPLRKVTEGRKRTIYSLDVGKAKPEDAELIAKALNQQHTAAYQELFRRQFDERRAGIRARLISKPATTAAKHGTLSKPLDDVDLNAALDAAAESPSSKPPVKVKGSQPMEELSLAEQQLNTVRRGGGRNE